MNLTSKRISSFALRRVLEIFLTNFATCLQAASYGDSERAKLAREEFGNKTLAQDERTFQALRNSLSTTEAPTEDDDNDNKYYYIGGAVLAVIIILLLIVICCCCSRSKKKKKRKKESKKTSRKKVAATATTVNVFEPSEINIDTKLKESASPQTNTVSSVSIVEVHQTEDNDSSYQQNIPQSSQGSSNEPQSYVAEHGVASQRVYYGNENQHDQQKAYSAPFHISDEENLQGKHRHSSKGKPEVYSRRDVDGREFNGRKVNETATIYENEENSRVQSSVYPMAVSSTHRNANHNFQDDRMSQQRYDSVERKMNPPPKVAPKPSMNKRLSDRDPEYIVKVLPAEEYHSKNIDRSYPYSVHEKRVIDKTDRFPDNRNQKGITRPQSLYSDDPRYSSSKQTRQTDSCTHKDNYNDKRYSHDPSNNYKKATTSNSLEREDFNSPYKEKITTKKDIAIPDPDYISVSSFDNLAMSKESDEEKPPIAPKPSIKPREFKGPYGPDDLDDMFNPLTMAMRNRTRVRMPFETDKD